MIVIKIAITTRTGSSSSRRDCASHLAPVDFRNVVAACARPVANAIPPAARIPSTARLLSTATSSRAAADSATPLRPRLAHASSLTCGRPETADGNVHRLCIAITPKSFALEMKLDHNAGKPLNIIEPTQSSSKFMSSSFLAAYSRPAAARLSAAGAAGIVPMSDCCVKLAVPALACA